MSYNPISDGAATATSAIMLGTAGAGLGSVFTSNKPHKKRNRKIGAIIGSVVGVGSAAPIAGAPFLCGMFDSKERQEQIDAKTRPLAAKITAAGMGAAAAGGVLGSMVSKDHPASGAVVGAALAGALVVGIFGTHECPKLDSGVGFTAQEMALFP